MKFEVTVSGEIDMGAIVAEWTEELKDELQKEVKTIDQNIKRDAPVGKTGDLKENIRTTPTEDRSGAEFVVGVSYAAYLEFGTIEKVDLTYISDIQAEDYAELFRGSGIKQSGGIAARKYFFRNIRQGFFNFIEKMNNSDGSR